MTEYREASCRECPGKFELIPPPDPNYSVPKKRPMSDDYIERNYDCDQVYPDRCRRPAKV